jgi:hypothetical protein
MVQATVASAASAGAAKVNRMRRGVWCIIVLLPEFHRILTAVYDRRRS